MPSLYELHSHGELESPVLLLATESWTDAGLGAQAAIAQILETIPTEVLATFNSDDLIDFRSRRPIVRIAPTGGFQRGKNVAERTGRGCIT